MTGSTPAASKNAMQVIAIVGKGGVGKTTFTALLTRCLIEAGHVPFLIDADPTMSHLARVLGVPLHETLEHVRQELVRTAARRDSSASATLADQLDDVVADSVVHTRDFSLLALGQPESAGCFCPSNTLLRSVIEKIFPEYDCVMIDCEAGLEQIHRKVIRVVDFLVVVTDTALRSLETAGALVKSARKFTKFKHVGLVINRVPPRAKKMLLARAGDLHVPILGTIPNDDALLEIELSGRPFREVPPTSRALEAVREILSVIRETSQETPG